MNMFSLVKTMLPIKRNQHIRGLSVLAKELDSMTATWTCCYHFCVFRSSATGKTRHALHLFLEESCLAPKFEGVWQSPKL